MATQGCKFVLQMGSTVVLARLLTPQDYGLMGMVTVVTGFVSMFNDMGLSTATVQVTEINHRQISTLFWINVVLSGAIMLLTAAIAPAIAWFYSEPRLTLITLVLASGFILSGLSVQHRALLNRQMHFSALAIIDITSLLVAVITAIVSAWYGAGYWALVFMQLAWVLTGTVGTWFMCGWRPGPPAWRSGVRSMLAFGGHMTGSRVLFYLTRNLDNLLIGRYLGAQQLGLYANAYKLLLLPIQQINAPISSVAIPTLSRLQSDPKRYVAYYQKAIMVITALGMPIVVFLFVAADKAILTFLGAQWLPAIPLFRMLAPAAFFGTFNMATGWVFTSLGQPDRQFRWTIFTSTATVIGYVIGIQWGAIGVAAAFSIVFCGLSMGPLAIAYCFRDSPLKVSDLIAALRLPTLASIMAGAVLFAANYLFPFSSNPAIGLLIDLGIYISFYILTWSVLPNGRKSIHQILLLVKDLRRKPK